MEPIKRVPLVHQVEEQIEKLIDESKYAPGSKLPTELELCQALNVSRGTVREAFRFLQAKGVVELRAGRGAFVSEPAAPENSEAISWLVENEEDLKNVIELRAAIEPLAAKLTAERCSDAAAAELRALYSQFVASADESNYAELARLDEQFHSKIVENCGNDLIIDIVKRLNDGMTSFRRNTFQVNKHIKDTVGPHGNVMKAIVAHDSVKAEREMRKHLNKVAENLILNVSSSGLKDE